MTNAPNKSNYMWRCKSNTRQHKYWHGHSNTLFSFFTYLVDFHKDSREQCSILSCIPYSLFLVGIFLIHWSIKVLKLFTNNDPCSTTTWCKVHWRELTNTTLKNQSLQIIIMITVKKSLLNQCLFPPDILFYTLLGILIIS